MAGIITSASLMAADVSWAVAKPPILLANNLAFSESLEATITEWFPLTRLAAMASPILPSPMMATFVLCLLCSFYFVLNLFCVKIDTTKVR